MLLAELRMRVFFYIVKALIFQERTEAAQQGDAFYKLVYAIT